MQRSSQIAEPGGGRTRRDKYCKPRVEVELCVRSREIPQGTEVGIFEAINATEYVSPTIEIVDARVKDPRRIFDTISDNGAAAGIVLDGKPVRPHDIDPRWPGCILYKNAQVEETGLEVGVLGHPAQGVAGWRSS